MEEKISNNGINIKEENNPEKIIVEDVSNVKDKPFYNI